MQPSVSVVVCAYTMQRWDQILRAVASLENQTVQASQIVLVVDHNPELLARARAEINNTETIPSGDPPGLSTARNTGIARATGSIVAFLDDDARADPDWIEHLIAPFADPDVVGVGGRVNADWRVPRPVWFPAEFDWVVGCSYEGLPRSTAPVRNVIGCNMAFRRRVFDQIGGFNPNMGRVGNHPVGCEETELCIRARRHQPGWALVHEPAANVSHEVPAERTNWDYFFHRCYAEGLSKARVVDLVGADRGLSTERGHVRRVLTRGVRRGIGDAVVRRRPGGLGRATAIVAGLAVTTMGFVIGLARLRLRGRRTQRSTREKSDFEPTLLIEAELASPLPTVHQTLASTGKPYLRAQVLARLAGRPLGTTCVDIPTGGLDREVLAACIRNDLAETLRRHFAAMRLDLPDALPLSGVELPVGGGVVNYEPVPISVVVATRDRPESLRRCLKSMGRLDYPTYEVIVVDNAPATGATKEIVAGFAAEDPAIRYVFEPTPGLGRAHNTGRANVYNPIVAFTDDDVVVDPGWLSRIAAAFQTAPGADCVTGLIYPGELETPAQQAVEALSYSKGYETRSFNLSEHRVDSPLFPYAAGVFGSGANMAFRTGALDRIGGFDSALGAGSPGAGGDDLAAFLDIVASGGTIVYEPAAMVYHFHDTGLERLRRQAYGYGVGLGAYLTRAIAQQPRRLGEFIRLTPKGALHFLRSGPTPQVPGLPGRHSLALRRLLGAVNGPRAYLAGRRADLHANNDASDLGGPPS